MRKDYNSGMRIIEIFESLQGEGLWLGMPSWFVRLAGCNLACAWCDTPYARDAAAGTAHTLAQVLDLARMARPQHVVITGGEPTLAGDELIALCAGLRRIGKVVTVESNATMFVDCNPPLMSLSPKSEVWHDDVLAAYVQRGYCVQVKVVVRDAAEARAAAQRLLPLAIPRERLFLMPLAHTREEHLCAATWLAPLCGELGVRLAVRAQALLWNGMRGR
ncbi:MAG: 7-carboxy-7-deazaguanine synthase QueE [bacterium]|nr:7-carboxy-7-deazaguanine synthase QueE [bacterium]